MEKPRTSPVPARLDHLIYTVPDLDVGLREIEGLLGVRPVLGGRHPDYGTRNALLSLGESIYLEIMAPDPELPRPPRGRLFGLDTLERPRLATWVVRDEAIEETAEEAASRGLDLGPVQAGSRERPDGTVLSWRLTDPYADRLDGAVPFLIAWGDTPHPARGAPQAGELVDLRLEHPEPERVNSAWSVLGVDARVEMGLQAQWIATLRTDAGPVVLR